ncbi:MAG TPA: tail fiber protein, partial [Pirellulales bacterium]
MKTNQWFRGLAAFLCAMGMLSIAREVRAAVTGNTGGSLPFDTYQPSLAMNYLISLEGVFPSRDSGPPPEQFLGEVVPFAGNFAPSSWALANGQLMSISQNTALFSLLGTTYGGDGISTFALPDLRGRSAISTGQGPGLSNQFEGETSGIPQIALSDAQMPVHNHTLPGGGVTGIEGGNQPFNNMKPSLAMNYDINLQGIFPSQGGGGPTQFPILGQLNLFAGTFNPGGTAGANGQLLSIAQNTALFSILGTTYGGNGVTTFALPDLQDRTAISFGQGPGLTNRNEGDEIGHEATTLTVGQLPAHVHTLPGGGVTGATGGNLPFDNMGPSTALNYIIAVNGIFPPRDSGSTVSSDPFIGEVSLFAGNFAPSWWMLCNGQLLSISQNTALFSILGTTYGGNGTTNSALPNLQGRVPVHSGSSVTLGQVAGAASVTLAVNQFGHGHTVRAAAVANANTAAGNFPAAVSPTNVYGNSLDTTMNAGIVS